MMYETRRRSDRFTHLNGSGVRCHSGVVEDLKTGRMPSLQSLCYGVGFDENCVLEEWGYLVNKVFEGKLDFGGLVLVINHLEVKPRWISSFDRSPVTIGGHIQLELVILTMFLNHFLIVSFRMLLSRIQ